MDRMRILIVEDELIVARDLSQQVSNLGYEPAAITSRGDDAIVMAGQLHPDLVLMDVHLDGPLDGVDAARRIREEHRVPVVFLTALTSEAILERAKLARPYGYIVKPFEERELRTVIELAVNLHRSDRRLVASESRTRLLSRAVEQSPASIIITDASGTIQYVNPHFTRVTGYSAAEALGRNPRILKSGSLPDQFYREMWSTLAAGREWSGEFHNRHKNGTPFWEHASISPVRDDSGAITHYVAVKEDVTSRKAAEDHLLQTKAQLQETNAQLEVSIAQARELARAAEAANQAKSSFLAAMSHELRTPLNVINGISATLLEQQPTDSQRSALEMIHRSGQNLLGIIEEILDFTRLQAGRTPLDEQPCDLAVVAFHALRQAVERAGGKGLDIRCHITPTVPARIATDGRKLGQVLTNLLCNAVKFTECGHVELRLDAHRVEDDRWRLDFAVEDTGIGMDAATIQRLFQPFSQGDASVTRRYGGSGLGLAISRSITQLLGGDISVTSTPGAGSTFRFFVVARPTGDSTSLLAADRTAELDGKRALIAVAHPSHGSYITAMLRNWGLQCAVLDHGTLLPGSYGPSGAFDLLIVESDALPPGLRSRWNQLHVGAASAPVIWISHDRSPAPHPEEATRVRSLAWPVAPEDLKRAAVDLLNPTAASGHRVQGGHPANEPLGRRLPLRILAADDVRINRDVLRMMLKHLAYDPDFVENGAEVLEALEARSYDLVLLDVQMPVMDGLTAAREIVRRFPEPARRPRLVAITANALPESRRECLDAGMDDYLAKPVVPRQLEQCFLQLFRPGTETVPSPPAPDRVAAPDAPPWIDTAHLDTIIFSRTTRETHALLTQMLESFDADFGTHLPRLRQACRDRDARAAALLVHGLKGGGLTLGWARFTAECVEALTALRAGSFTRWDQLCDVLENTFAHSRGATEAWLDSWPADAIPPAPATPPGRTADRSLAVR